MTLLTKQLQIAMLVSFKTSVFDKVFYNAYMGKKWYALRLVDNGESGGWGRIYCSLGLSATFPSHRPEQAKDRDVVEDQHHELNMLRHLPGND